MYNNVHYNHNSNEATFSPYLNTNNPAMHPYTPQLNSYVQRAPIFSGRGLYGAGLF
jgi:hypothetical protein